MNKNIITLGFFATVSALADMSSITAPAIEFYTDSLVPKSTNINFRSNLTQVSLTKIGKSTLDISGQLTPSFINTNASININLNDADILASVAQRIKNSKPLDEEFSKIIDDNFWDLI